MDKIDHNIINTIDQNIIDKIYHNIINKIDQNL